MSVLGPEGLERLPDLIAKGVRVLAVLGPCGRCGRSKTGVVKSVLQRSRPIVTDLVLDVSAAQAVAEEMGWEFRSESKSDEDRNTMGPRRDVV